MVKQVAKQQSEIAGANKALEDLRQASQAFLTLIGVVVGMSAIPLHPSAVLLLSPVGLSDL